MASGKIDVGGGSGSERFISGVYTLTLSTVIVKIIGLIYKIPMLALLGDTGMGYFNSAYEIYALFCTVATSGLPVATSLMISSTKSVAKRKKIFRTSYLTVFTIGIICAVLILGLAYPFSVFLKSPKTYYSILGVAPAIFFICLSSAVRGYFQGTSRMLPTAVSQVIEASGKLIFGLIFATLGIKWGFDLPQISGMAVMGLAVAEAISAVYLFSLRRRDELYSQGYDVQDAGKEKIFGKLMKTTLPITFSSSILSVVRLIDMTLIFRRLGSSGVGADAINSMYGSYTTLAIPLFSLAPALVSGVALPIIPEISSARAMGDEALQNDTATKAFKLTALISAPIGAGLALYSKQILSLIFSGAKESVAFASPLLALLGLSVIESCFITVQNAILQAYEKSHLPLISMLIGSLFKIVICYILLGNLSINVYAIPIGTFVCDFCISVLNFAFLSRYSTLKFKFSEILIKPYLCGIFACGISLIITNLALVGITSEKIRTVLSVCLAAILYFILLISTKMIRKTDKDVLLLRVRAKENRF